MLLAAPMLCVQAHEVRPAYLQIKPAEGGGYEVLWKQPVVQNRRLPIDPVFPADCEMQDLAPPEVTPNALIHRWHTGCDLTTSTIHIEGLSVTLTDVMVKVDTRGGEHGTFILRPENPTLNLATETPGNLGYLVIGIEHLIFGIDHVLFVVGLVLLIRAPIMLLKTVTGFTVAHSITLALSVMGWVRLDQGPVEAVIALSIVFLARELLEDEAHRSRLTRAAPWIMAFVFGLLHGLGFAGALADIGLPDDDLWIALLLFNVGIEIGQLVIIAALLAGGWLLYRLWDPRRLLQAGTWVMGSIAAFWTIDRTIVLL
jgi:hypothetical protein